MQTFISDLSGQHFPTTERVTAHAIRQELLELIRKEHPQFNNRCSLAISELNRYRHQYFEGIFSKEISDLTELEKTVMEKMRDHETLTDKLVDNMESSPLSLGQKLADKIADFGGSWRFIILFLLFILVWIAVNIFWLTSKSFDPYPFILLNLILSCLAALQAPVIMMSQNRQEDKDRQRAKNDYMINLKSELEVRILHEKIDHLIIRQQQDVLDLQQTQIEMLNEITHAIKRLHAKNGNNNHKDTDTAK